jgi:hypothetical protein
MNPLMRVSRPPKSARFDVDIEIIILYISHLAGVRVRRTAHKRKSC